MSLFHRRANRDRAIPHHQHVTVPANVTLTKRDEADGLAFTPCAKTANHIRKHLPRAAEPLSVGKAGQVLLNYARWMEDPKSGLPCPDIYEVVAACKVAVDFICEKVTIE